ncbi:hypothetical protein AA313_de0203283 [Arthrobotrys entomopaga]|nr:hypothetical protein AA313_de0203283 [Arthrobotrys entomopaga]
MPKIYPTDFEIAIICALPHEHDAIFLLFDRRWGQNADYKTGRIGKHKVVLALLHKAGKVSAASKAAAIKRDFPNIELAFLVGVCAGVPTYNQRANQEEILLGDVVISNVIRQYDFGKQYPGGYTITGSFNSPATKPILSMLSNLQTDSTRDIIQDLTEKGIKHLQTKAAETNHHEKYKYPGAATDKLFRSEYRHQHRGHQTPGCCICGSGSDLGQICNNAVGSSCEDLGCEQQYIVPRTRLMSMQGGSVHRPMIHIGVIGSGDTVIKCGQHRDKLAKSANIIAFEMEGAGISEDIPCIVVKGVCDYADSHKNKKWQDFAAGTAASVLKAMLEYFDLFGRKENRVLSPPLSPLAPPAYSNLEEVIPERMEDVERAKRVHEIEKNLPELITTISDDLARKLQWAPHLSTAPSAICVMATCLVAGNQKRTSTIKVTNIQPINIEGVKIFPNKYLGTNLQYCSELGRKAFNDAETGMGHLRNQAELMTGVTGPLSQIVHIVNDSKPDFPSLERWMNKLVDSAATCQREAKLMKHNFQALLEFVIQLKKETMEASCKYPISYYTGFCTMSSAYVLFSVENQINLDDLEKEKKATKAAEELKIEEAAAKAFAAELQLANEKIAIKKKQLGEARSNLENAHEKMNQILEANPWVGTQKEIDTINSELSEMEKLKSGIISPNAFDCPRDGRVGLGGNNSDPIIPR